MHRPRRNIHAAPGKRGFKIFERCGITKRQHDGIQTLDINATEHQLARPLNRTQFSRRRQDRQAEYRAGLEEQAGSRAR